MDEKEFDATMKGSYNWLGNDPRIFKSAMNAVHSMLPRDKKRGLELNFGSAPFCRELQIQEWTISEAITLTGDRSGEAAKLPFENLDLDFIFVAYCNCLDRELPATFKEAYRTLKSDGVFVVAFIDPKSPSGKRYIVSPSEESGYDIEKIIFELTHAGFRHFEVSQTLFSPPEEITETQLPRPGYGEGSFLVLQARKKM